MSEAPATTPPATEPAAAAPTPPVEAPTPTEPAAAAPKANVWDDPKAAEAEIKRLRQENGAERVNAKQTAADEARRELANTIGKALGLVEDETIDPAKLTESLTQSQADAKQARVELAVFRNAATAGGDPAALLDSSSFLASLAAVDPSDSAAVSAAIQSAITANPRLGAAPAGPTTPAPNPAQGAGSNGPAAPQQLGATDLERMSPEQIVQARKDGQLADLLAGRRQ